MKGKLVIRALVGGAMCVVGLCLALATPYQSRIFVTDSLSCRMTVQVVEPVSGEAKGSVVLFHGISAGKRIMSHFAHTFSEQNLRVFVPDLPGHGRTPGPFSFSRVESCSETFVKQLIVRRAIDPAHTILAGHSMGGAIAVKVAARTPVAGVIALSPAPMSAAQGVPREMLPYQNPPPAPPNTLVISASLEPRAVRDSARDLLSREAMTTGKYMLIPQSTHVSLLFDDGALQASQDWAAQVLNLNGKEHLPSKLPLLGFWLGFVGLILLTAPFVRELLGKTRTPETYEPARVTRLLAEIFVFSLLATLFLRTMQFYSVLRVFEGDYLGGFVLLVGAALLLSHYRDVRTVLHASFGTAQLRTILLASLCAGTLLLLYSGWLDLALSAAWLTSARWLRFPLFLLALLPFHLAEEILLGPIAAARPLRRFILSLGLRLMGWSALIAGVFFLHSGELLMILLVPYFAIFCVLQRLVTDVVREQTGSASSAAIFGAILMAGFCLAIFPVA